MEKYKLGKNPLPEDSTDLKLGSYLDTSVLPELPDGDFTIADLVAPEEWGMLLNDKLGDCAPAGISHAQKALARVGDHDHQFTDASVQRGYELMGHYVPGQPATDQGCDLRTCAKVWQKHGIPTQVPQDRDDLHESAEEIAPGEYLEFIRCGIYLWLEPGNVQEQWYATYVLKNAINGYDLPANWMEAFDAGDYVWDYDPSSKSLGGHCVPAFGRVADGTDGVSWGHRLSITGAAIQNNHQEGFTVVSSSTLQGDGEILGLDHEKLVHDLKALQIMFHDGVVA
jgi:hypothetical protein